MSISAVVIVAAPLASSVNVTSCVTTVGTISSTTVTEAVAVSVLPDASSTVRVTVVAAAMFVQSKALISKLRVNAELSVQLSEDPLSTSAAVRE